MDIICKDELIYYKKQQPYYANSNNNNKQLSYTDDSFPPNRVSLLGSNKGNSMDGVTVFDSNDITWKRLSEIYKDSYCLFNKELSINDINQGDIGNCYLISVLLSLIDYPNVIKALFRSHTISLNGYYEIVFFIDGMYQIVIIDDYLPFNTKTNRLVFSRPNGNEIWAVLIEKAWAKVNGGYSNMIGGYPYIAFQTLTGYPSKRIIIKDYNTNNDDIWKIISKNLSIILCCNSKVFKDKYDDTGLILSNHAYCIISTEINYNKEGKKEQKNKMIQLRNPWGNKAKQSLIWLSLNVFIEKFLSIDICYLLSPNKSMERMLDISEYIHLPLLFNMTINNGSGNSPTFITIHKPKVNMSIPCIVLLIKVDQTKRIIEPNDIIGAYESDDDSIVIAYSLIGHYLIYTYSIYPNELNLKNINTERSYLKVTSESSFLSIAFTKVDESLSLLRYTLIESIKLKYKQDLDSINNREGIISYIETNYLGLGLQLRIVINDSNDLVQLWKNNTTKLVNIILLPPYDDKASFEFRVLPKSISLVIGIKKSKYGDFWFNLSSNYKTIQCTNKDKEILPIDVSFSIRDYIEEDLILTPYMQCSNNSMNIPKEITDRLDPITLGKLSKLPHCCYDINKDLKWTYRKTTDSGEYYGQTNQLGQREGIGIFKYYSNRHYYIGYWLNDMKFGIGFDYNEEHFLYFKGHYKDNQRNGYGILYWSNGDSFHGFFKSDIKEGFGITKWNHKAKWEGYSFNGKLNGFGLYYPPSKAKPYIVNCINDQFA